MLPKKLYSYALCASCIQLSGAPFLGTGLYVRDAYCTSLTPLNVRLQYFLVPPMDPLSVVASAANLVQLCAMILEGLRVVCEARNVNFAVLSLRDEIGTLKTILNHVEDTFTAFTGSPLRMRPGQDHTRDVRYLLHKCQQTLEALDQIIKTLNGKNGFATNLLRQIRLNKITGNIRVLKANIHCYTQMLQVSLMTISM